MSYYRPTPDATHQREERAGGRQALTVVVLLLVVLFGGGIGLTLLRLAKGPHKVVTPPRRVHSGPVRSREAEAAAVEAAIAEKPAELRKALSAYAESSEDIRRILSQSLEVANIGGAVAVATANLQKNAGRGIDSPEQLGFRRIDDDRALVNRAQRGEIEIVKVTVSPAGEHLFEVTIVVTNNTQSELECAIPKGQLVEIQNGRNAPENGVVNTGYEASEPPQTSARAHEETEEGGVTVVPPWEPDKIKFTTIKFTAYCANPNLPRPEGAANLTIYALEDTSYKTPDDLRVLRTRKLNLPSGKNAGAGI
jgi:hypothetical protein